MIQKQWLYEDKTHWYTTWMHLMRVSIYIPVENCALKFLFMIPSTSIGCSKFRFSFSELHFLILRYLESGPCKEAARVSFQQFFIFLLSVESVDLMIMADFLFCRFSKERSQNFRWECLHMLFWATCVQRFVGEGFPTDCSLSMLWLHSMIKYFV